MTSSHSSIDTIECKAQLWHFSSQMSGVLLDFELSLADSYVMAADPPSITEISEVLLCSYIISVSMVGA